MLALLASMWLFSNVSKAQPLPFYPADVSYADVQGYRVAYFDSGQNLPPLLLVHGLGSNMTFWRDHIDLLSASFRVIAVDLPGFGLSSKQDVPGTMAFYADILAALLDALEIPQVRYAGVSMGGQIGMTFALRHPDRVSHLVLAAPAGIETFTPEQGNLLRATYTAQVIMNTTPEQYERNVALNFAGWDRDRFGWILEQRATLILREDYAAYAQANVNSMQGMLEGPVIGEVSNIKVPVLAVFGAQDALIPNRYLNPHLTPETISNQARTALPPHARVELLQNAGHLLIIEQAEAFRALMLEEIRN